jgi:hypothetical protein
MRPELGFEVRMRILYAFLSGVFGTMGVIALVLHDIGGASIFISFGAVLMFMASTNRWHISASRDTQ